MDFQDEHTVRGIMMSSPVTLQADGYLNLADEIMTLSGLTPTVGSDKTGQRLLIFLSQRRL
jgi:hypothetical protein